MREYLRDFGTRAPSNRVAPRQRLLRLVPPPGTPDPAA